ncbi:MAG: hypothetical protein JKY48_09160 [Flavobacteriales bacterium]|nr:hypothetical protein [Flavobacteriales bacterium]
MVKYLIKYSKVVLVAVGLLTIVFGYFSQMLKFDYNVESYFDENDPKLNYYKEHKERFGNDFNFILVGLNAKKIIDHSFLVKVDSISRNLNRLKLITKVQSLSNIKEYVASPLGPPIGISLFHLNDSSKFLSDF